MGDIFIHSTYQWPIAQRLKGHREEVLEVFEQLVQYYGEEVGTQDAAQGGVGQPAGAGSAASNAAAAKSAGARLRGRGLWRFH